MSLAEYLSGAVAAAGLALATIGTLIGASFAFPSAAVAFVAGVVAMATASRRAR